MAKRRLDISLTLAISIITLIISILTILYGDNLYDRFRGSQITLSTKKDEFKLPDKITKFIKDKDKNNEINLPNAIRVLTITNNGSIPSKNLNIVLEMDGPIFQYKLNSTEKIENEEIKLNRVSFSLPRLSKNAEIQMIFWMQDSNNKFQGNFADDNNSGIIEDISSKSSKELFPNFIIVLISLLSIVMIGKEVIYKLILNFELESKIKTNILKDEIETKFEEQYLDKQSNVEKSNSYVEDIERRKKTLKELIEISEKLFDKNNDK